VPTSTPERFQDWDHSVVEKHRDAQDIRWINWINTGGSSGMAQLVLVHDKGPADS
jgi:hypothetical protein